MPSRYEEKIPFVSFEKVNNQASYQAINTAFNSEEDNGSSEIDERLVVFTKTFVNRFENKLKEFKKEASVGGQVKVGKNTADVSKAVNLTAVGAVAAATGGSEFAKPVATLGTKYITELVANRTHRQKAKRITDAFDQTKKDELRKLLVRIGGEIFRSFECQFRRVTDVDGFMRRGMDKLAIDAMNRAINYIDKCTKDTKLGIKATMQLIGEGVLKGDSKNGGHTLMVSKYHPVNKVKRKEEWKTEELYAKLGIVLIKGKGGYTRYYSRSSGGGNATKFGYRLLCQWEDTEDSLQDYNEDTPPTVTYKYLLTREKLEIKMKEILQKIDREDVTAEAIKSGLNTLLLANGEIGSKDEKIWEEFNGFDVLKPLNLFAGRIEKLHEMHTTLNCVTPAGPALLGTVCISGLGGVGKSQLTRKYVDTYGEDDYNNKVVWINATSGATIAQCFRRLAKEVLQISTLNVDGEEKSILSVVDSVYKFFSRGKHLFVFDGAEKYKSGTEETEQTGIDKFLPRNYANNELCHVIITSIHNRWGKIKVIPLDSFTIREASWLIRASLGLKDESQQEADVENLAKTLHGFPLALTQAVAYIKNADRKRTFFFTTNTTYKIEDYLKAYKTKAEELLSFAFQEEDIDEVYTKTTLTTWQITIERIKMTEDHLQDFLEVIAYFGSYKIPADIFLKLVGNDAEALASVIATAWDYSLISSQQNKLISVHGLVQQIIRIGVNEENREENVLKKAIELLNGNEKIINRKPADGEITSHILSIWKYASKYGDLVNDHYFNSIYGSINDATPLHLLATHGNEDEVAFILEHIRRKCPARLGEVINCRDRHNRTALYLAAENGHVNILKILAASVKDVDIRTKSTVAYASLCTKRTSGWTAMHIAAFHGHLEAVKFLAEIDADLANIKDSGQRIPADLAVNGGHVAVVEFLMPGNKEYLLHASLIGANVELIRELIENDVDVNSVIGNLTALHLATVRGDLEIVKLLVYNNALIERSDCEKSALFVASAHGHLEVVRFLLKEGANPDTVNEVGDTSLHIAAKYGHLSVVGHFVMHYASSEKIIDVRDNKGATPLHTAALNGQLETVKFLFANGANLNATDKLGSTVVASAAVLNNCDIVTFLIGQENVIFDHLDTDTLIGALNLSVLHIAAAYDALDVVEILVKDKNVDVNVGESASVTPLHVAAFFDSKKVMEYLIRNGANVDAVANLSNIKSILEEVEMDISLEHVRTVKILSMINKAINFMGSNLNTLKITPRIVYQFSNQTDNEILEGKINDRISNLLVNKFSKQTSIQNVLYDYKLYIQERKYPGNNRPANATVYGIELSQSCIVKRKRRLWWCCCLSSD